MPKFICEITETLQYQEIIKADSLEEAENKLREKYKNEVIVLDYNHFVGAEFNVVKKEKNHER